jgi:hypothetical protein
MKRKNPIRVLPGQLVLPEIAPADITLADLADDIRAEQGYAGVRALPDGTIVALGRLASTTAVYVDLLRTGWASRYCFESAPLAVAAFDQVQSGEDVPAGCVAERGR